MASSQVQISPSSGCVLRNQNWRDRYSSNRFHKNLKVLVNSSIPDSDENAEQIDLTDLWVHKPQHLDKTRLDDERRSTSTMESDNWDKVREMVFSADRKNLGEGKTEISLPRPETSAAVPHSGGVSSLVQRWRDFEVVSKTVNPAANNNNNSSVCFSRSNSTTSTLCDDSSVDGRFAPASFGDGESPPSREKDSDASERERERLRVADIIKKLTFNTGEDNQSDPGGNESAASPRVRTPTDHQVLNSPRIIRGRQAFAEMLMQMERERLREIEGLVEHKTVSKFQHKGRIQAMLRLKILRGQVDFRDSRPLNYKASESNRSTQSSITNLRERFNAGLRHGLADSKTNHKEVPHNTSEAGKVSTPNNHREAADSISHNREAPNSSPTVGNVSTSCQLEEEEHPLGVEQISPHSGSSAAGIQLEACPKSNGINSSVCEETRSHNESTQCLECVRPLSNSEETGNTEEREDNEQQVAGTGHNGRDEEDMDHHQPMESEWGWASEYSHTQSGLDEPEVSQDWITDVSRPRSDWEDLRQARYQEMLDPFIDNHDIQELLQRRSVSNFLSGGLREKIDQLMISRSQGHQRTINTNVQEVKEQAAADYGNEVKELGQVARGRGEYQEVEEDEDDGDDNEEYDCQIQEQLNGLADSVDQNWSYNQDRDLSDDSDQTTSAAYSPQPQSSNFYSPNNQQYCHPSIEIQLIYELKSQVEQLHQEMFEIQRSIKSCVNMQMKLQRSIKHEVSAVLAQSGQNRGRSSGNKRPRKGNCCICCDKKVDSLLYRCGHLCTCFNCAHHLQSGEGKCPICQAPIIDIVRTHTH